MVDQTRVVKDALVRSIVGDLTLLKHTSVVVITKDGSESFGVTVPGIRAFGLSFPWCGRKSCQSKPGDVVVKTKHRDRKVSLKCSTCGWRSPWLSADDLDFISNVGPSHPRVYFAPYPLTAAQQLVFISTKDVNAQETETGTKKRKTADDTMDVDEDSDA
jgi:hypothetical protein